MFDKNQTIASFDPEIWVGITPDERKEEFLRDFTAAGLTVQEVQAGDSIVFGNYELNVVVLDPGFGRDMEAAFNEDLRSSKQVTLDQWRDRPWKDRLREFIGRLAEYWI